MNKFVLEFCLLSPYVNSIPCGFPHECANLHLCSSASQPVLHCCSSLYCLLLQNPTLFTLLNCSPWLTLPQMHWILGMFYLASEKHQNLFVWGSHSGCIFQCWTVLLQHQIKPLAWAFPWQCTQLNKILNYILAHKSKSKLCEDWKYLWTPKKFGRSF